MRNWILVGLLAALAVACQGPVGERPASLSSPPAFGRLTSGIPAPDFTLERLDGGSVRLWELRGKVVLLNFWATWCEPCRREMPLLAEIYRMYHPQGVEVLGVNLTSQDDLAEVRRFVAAFDLPFPILLDHNGRVERAYGLFGVPTTVFIDREGIIQRVVMGVLKSRADVEGTLRPLLGP